MRLNFEQQLAACCRGRVCLMGIGNVDGGDDGLGIRLAEAIQPERRPEVEIICAGSAPEHCLGASREKDWDNLIFLDAVDFGAAPGSVVLLGSAEMAARFPQISTHRISLGLLAQCVESNLRTRVWLLGVQPASLLPGSGLSRPVARALQALADALTAALESNRVPFAIT